MNKTEFYILSSASEQIFAINTLVEVTVPNYFYFRCFYQFEEYVIVIIISILPFLFSLCLNFPEILKNGPIKISWENQPLQLERKERAGKQEHAI